MDTYQTLKESADKIVAGCVEVFIALDGNDTTWQGIRWTGNVRCFEEEVFYEIDLPGSWNGSEWFNGDTELDGSPIFVDLP